MNHSRIKFVLVQRVTDRVRKAKICLLQPALAMTATGAGGRCPKASLAAENGGGASFPFHRRMSTLGD
jgi:hypothetical protein